MALAKLKKQMKKIQNSYGKSQFSHQLENIDPELNVVISHRYFGRFKRTFLDVIAQTTP